MNRARVYISTYEALVEFCQTISDARVVAVDTEFLREKTYFPKLCLVQVAAQGHVAAIDPILIEDLTPLRRVFEDPNVVKVFHACSQDLEVLLEGMGCACAPVFDTQVAGAFCGMRHQVSLSALVEHYCHVHLPKAESLTDWSRRPLEPEQLAYAEDDVRYLESIYDAMMARLIELDRISWVMPEMESVTDIVKIHRDPRNAYLKLRRSGSLTRRQLAVAREVCAWREEVAAAHDTPRKWVASDEVVIEICKRTPSSVERVRRIRGTERISDAEASRLVDAVAAGVACPSADCPHVQRTQRPSAEAEGVVDLMNAVVRIVSEKSGVATQIIATRDDLQALLGNPSESRLSSGWRHELAGATLERLLAGEVGLTVKEGRIELL